MMLLADGDEREVMYCHTGPLREKKIMSVYFFIKKKLYCSRTEAGGGRGPVRILVYL